MSRSIQNGAKSDNMNEEQRKKYLKRLYQLAGNHYTPEEKETYLNKLYAEQADASMIRAAAMQVYRARKAKEKHDDHKERSPTSVITPSETTTPPETKTPMTVLRGVFELFSCADLEVVDNNGENLKSEESGWLCGAVDEKFIRGLENNIVQKHFTVPPDKETSSQSNINNDIKPLKERGRVKVGRGVVNYEASNLDNYLKSNGANNDDGFTSLEFLDQNNDDDDNDTALILAMNRTYVNQNKKTIPRELFLNEVAKDDLATPRNIYISSEATENDEAPVTTISTSKLETQEGSKIIVIVPTSPKKRKPKTKKTNKKPQRQSHDDHEIPFDEHNSRMNNLVESVQNLPFDEASYTISFNAEEFVDHLVDRGSHDDYRNFDYDIKVSERKGLTVEELALDVEYLYER